MTGYGKAEGKRSDLSISVEVRSLNSKFLDLKIRLPMNLKDKELPLRRQISDKVHRGKVDVIIEWNGLKDGSFSLNKSLFKRYYEEIAQLNSELEVPQGDVMQAILKLPNVVQPDEENVAEEDYAVVLDTIDKALAQFDQFRVTEGNSIADDMKKRVESIASLLDRLDPYEEQRVQQIRKRLTQLLDQYMSKEHIDENRFEQELLFYLEKIDINEEKVRLSQHCSYFLEQLNGASDPIGKKLNFIGQEMGREINTMGAKAYSAEIQRLVILMKDELEKIKEQVANVV